MTLEPKELWVLVTLFLAISVFAAIFATATLEGLLMKLQEYNDNPHLKLRFLIAIMAWVVPSVAGITVCVIKLLSLD